MDPNQQQLLLTGGGTKEVYVDEVFNTHCFLGNGTARTITTGMDYTDKGGLTWFKNRDSGTNEHNLFDTVRGVQKDIRTNTWMSERTSTSRLNAFSSTGFTIGNDSDLNNSGDDIVCWSFLKEKGFFDIVKYNGNATNSSSPPQEIPHNLGCKPGAIWIKSLTSNQSWASYHHSLGPTRYMGTNSEGVGGTSAAYWNDVEPTKDIFTVGYDGQVNENNNEYIAYLWAGADSDADTARSIYCNGSAGAVFTSSSTSYEMGTGLFTVEMWIKPDDSSGSDRFFFGGRPSTSGSMAEYGFDLYMTSDNYVYGRRNSDSSPTPMFTSPSYQNRLALGAWNHIAVVRHGTSDMRLYVNGQQSGSTYTNHNDDRQSEIRLGQKSNGGNEFKGGISNVRMTKGQALYTAAFKPPTEPLTTTSQGAIASNVKLLCCQNTTITGATVAAAIPLNSYGGTISASTDNPFPDPTSMNFGEEGDQDIIKCGIYTGNTGTGDFEVHLGWEPQFIIIKRTSGGNANWSMFDNMRGINSEHVTELYLYPNLTHQEYDAERISLTPTGFKVDAAAGILINNANDEYIYIAVRRPDPKVQKPAEAGTDVFAMDTGNPSTPNVLPTFDSEFPIDFATMRQPGSGQDWYTTYRLVQKGYISFNNNNTENLYQGFQCDSNVGWARDSSYGASYQSWMWKRHAGMDVVTYNGNGKSNRQIPHSLGRTPEMMWLKARDSGTYKWNVYHSGANGGVTPENWYILFTNGLPGQYTPIWNDTAPTSTSFTVGSYGEVNHDTTEYVMMLFASVTNICKVGWYEGDGTDNGTKEVPVGFQPRFLIIKEWNTSASTNWNVFDTLRGLGAGVNTLSLNLNDTNAQTNQGSGKIELSATAFIPGSGGEAGWNGNGKKYIYYAHA